MSKPKALNFEQRTTTGEAIGQLEAILQKLKEGSVTLSAGGQEAVVEATDQVKLSVEVKQAPGASTLKLKLKWKEASGEAALGEPLNIG